MFGGWHKDTSSQERVGHTFHWDRDYLMVEAGFYLQDNDTEFAGGLDVEPGSHDRPDEYVHPKPRWFITRVLRRLTGKRDDESKNALSIPSKAGDLVIFHFRINHRATQPKNHAFPLDKQKMAIFIGCSRNNSHVASYHDFTVTRSDGAYLSDFSYPREFLEECAKHGVTLA
jgi:hypothetical protein